ncbi:tRNA 5'-guanylyltransferase [bacterium]|nr:tRNA 5'-guanylyltransferase [bacterium]
MKFDALEERMRSLEVYHSLRVLPQAWPILRVDGRNFSKFTEKRFQKPFDPAFHQAMVQASTRLLEELHALYVYTESDEISILLDRETRLFDREHEKLVSISAATASAALSLAFQAEVHFDSRLCVAANSGLVLDYFQWRQADAARCCLNGWCYWTLRQEGLTVREATRQLHGRNFSWKNELLFQRGINFNDLPGWQKRGSGIYWQEYEKIGCNPLTGTETCAIRRRIHKDEDLPMGSDYAEFLKGFLGGA